MNVRWGFIGAGFVASKAVSPAVRAASNATLVAVASRDLNRAQALSPLRTYSGSSAYEQIITDPDVDAIYINLANQDHHQWVIAALLGGKHVLCEKPLAINLRQVKEMADAADQSGKLLIEATWLRWHPRFQCAVELVSNGSLGQLTNIESSFTFTADLKDNFRGQEGGGSLLDVGTYQFQLWRALLSPWISPTISNVKQVVNDAGVDLSTQVSAEVELPNGSIVNLSAESSFIAAERQFIKISGTQGVIEFTKGAAFTSWQESSALSISGHIEEFAPVDAYQLMIEAVSAKIGGQEAWVLPIQESLDIAHLIDAIVHTGAR
jgi:predicted dehydrogenase